MHECKVVVVRDISNTGWQRHLLARIPIWNKAWPYFMVTPWQKITRGYNLATGDPVTKNIAGSNTGYGIPTASWKVAITRKKKGEKSKIGIGKEVIKRAATRTREKIGRMMTWWRLLCEASLPYLRTSSLVIPKLAEQVAEAGSIKRIFSTYAQ